MNYSEKKSLSTRVTIIGAFLDLILGLGKIIVGSLYLSQALIVDGIHSLSDILTDVFVILITFISHEKPDDDHPYGHARFETLGTIVIGFILIVVAVFLAIENIESFIAKKESVIPGTPTIIITIISIFSKEWIYRKTLAVGELIQSELLIANAWHSRTDAISSVLVLVSLVVSMAGFPQVDIFTAIVLSFFIGKVGWDFVWKSIKELVDTSLDQDQIKEVKKVILSVDGVKGMHNLRSRKMGSKAILDVNVEVSPYITVSEGHEISTWVANKVIKSFPNIKDITVHTDVDDDRGESDTFEPHSYELLPLRSEVIATIQGLVEPSEFKHMTNFDLHYYNGKIRLYLTINAATKNVEIENKLLAIEYISEVHFFQKL